MRTSAFLLERSKTHYLFYENFLKRSTRFVHEHLFVLRLGNICFACRQQRTSRRLTWICDRTIVYMGIGGLYLVPFGLFPAK